MIKFLQNVVRSLHLRKVEAGYTIHIAEPINAISTARLTCKKRLSQTHFPVLTYDDFQQAGPCQLRCWKQLSFITKSESVIAALIAIEMLHQVIEDALSFWGDNQRQVVREINAILKKSITSAEQYLVSPDESSRSGISKRIALELKGYRDEAIILEKNRRLHPGIRQYLQCIPLLEDCLHTDMVFRYSFASINGLVLHCSSLFAISVANEMREQGDAKIIFLKQWYKYLILALGDDVSVKEL